MTKNTHPIESTPSPSSRRRRTRPFLVFGLGTLAIGGIGAAVTTAAWTDNAFFAAPSAAATFNLQGSLDGVNWNESDNPDSIELVIPREELADLLPGQSRSVKLWVRNQGSVNAALTSAVSIDASSTFVENPTAELRGLVASLTPATESGSSDEFELTITTPADWSPQNQGASAAVVVTIAATATS